MCLAVPGKILDVEEKELRAGRVDFGGVVKEVCLAYVPEAGVGDYVIVHAGFAISRIDEEEAKRVLDDLKAMDALASGEDVAP